ncbi:hypothetical protein OAU07_08005, partial [Alphaproteobacteria bacterium]|nr:hypothetical protein [Alphaproteobacteria bacterium]
MLRKGSSIMRIPSQLISNSWLISVLVHIALIIALREAYPAKKNHTNDEFKKIEFVIYQPEPDKLPQKEIPKDIAKAASKVKSISVSKQSVVSKPDIISEVKIVSQSKSITEPEILSSEISKNKLKTIPKPKPKPKPTPNSTIIAKETLQTRNPNQKTSLTDASFSDLAARKLEYMDKNAFNDKATGKHK